MTSSWFFLSTLNYDARSTTHQIYNYTSFSPSYTYCYFQLLLVTTTVLFWAIMQRVVVIPYQSFGWKRNDPTFKSQESEKDFDLLSPEERSSHLPCGGNFKSNFQFVIIFDFLVCTKVICKIWILRCWNTYLTATMKLVRALTL